MFFWALFVTFALWMYITLTWVWSRRLRVQSRIETAMEWGHINTARVVAGTERRDPFMRRLFRVLGGRWFKAWSSERLSRLQTKLSQAGAPMHLSSKEWLGLRLAAVLIGCVAGMMLAIAMGLRFPAFVLWLAIAVLSLVGPDFWLSKRITKRQLLILKQLPSALDLLTVSVEAGLGFDQAIERLATKLSGPVAEEFGRTLREIQLGSPRAQALQRMAARTGVEAVRTFVSSVVQSERLGVGMAQVLRIQAAEVRRKRRMDAEERAMKAPVKMLFPLIMFVFPALFVVVLGPAAINMIKMFSTH